MIDNDAVINRRFFVGGLYNAAGFPREGPYGQEESDREEGIA